jgi:ribosomal protein L29
MPDNHLTLCLGLAAVIGVFLMAFFWSMPDEQDLEEARECIDLLRRKLGEANAALATSSVSNSPNIARARQKLAKILSILNEAEGNAHIRPKTATAQAKAGLQELELAHKLAG